MSNVYDVGDLIRLKATFTDPNNSNLVLDPTTVTIVYKNPSGSETTLVYGTDAEVKKLSTGIYYLDISVTLPGKWIYRWYSTGIGQAAEEGTFSARQSRI